MAENQYPMEYFTPHAQRVLAFAKRHANEQRHGDITVEHLLLGLLDQKDGLLCALLKVRDNTPADVKKRLHTEDTASDAEQADRKRRKFPVDDRVQALFGAAAKQARSFNFPRIGTHHILLAMLEKSGTQATEILREFGIEFYEVHSAIYNGMQPEAVLTQTDREKNRDEERPKNVANKKEENSNQRFGEAPEAALKRCVKDLTRLAGEQKLEPVIGRENETARVLKTLCRRDCSNPLLLGEAGVGKTAVAEGVAQQIVAGTVPKPLRDKRIIAVRISDMLAGCELRGQFEERLYKLIETVQEKGNVILFIDEFHTIVGAGSAGRNGTMDASNILKPALSRGNIQCIGATTSEEYRKYIETDAALVRRFQPVTLAAPSEEQAIGILQGIKHKYEQHHHVKYADGALQEAVQLSEKYMPERNLPDKAIHVMDEAGSHTRAQTMAQSDDLRNLQDEITRKRTEKENAIRNSQFNHAAELRQHEKELEDELCRKQNGETTEKRQEPVYVTVEEIRTAISQATGVPVETVQKSEAERLMQAETILGEQVIGQEEAVQSVARTLRCAKADLKDPERPIGTFIFVGPTGVGKTLLANAVNNFMFGEGRPVIQFDMSEYMDEHSVGRLTGAAPGYVGHENGGQLTEAIRRNPWSVLLFDEIEKAHPEVMHILLQIMEEGHITDARGRTADCRNTLIIMTSNLGAGERSRTQPIGFNPGGADSESDISEKEHIKQRLNATFSPEFVNRVDELVVFRKLEHDDLTAVIELEMDKLRQRLAKKNIQIALSADARNLLMETAQATEYGARQIRSVVEHYIAHPLAEKILNGKIVEGEEVNVERNGEGMDFVKAQPKVSGWEGNAQKERDECLAF